MAFLCERCDPTVGWSLVFRKSYFKDLLDRTGWTYDKFQSTANGLVFSIVSKQKMSFDAGPTHA